MLLPGGLPAKQDFFKTSLFAVLLNLLSIHAVILIFHAV